MLRFLKLAAVALGLMAGPAAAATVEVVWTGTVYGDYDNDGTDSTGESITATLIYDTDLGQLDTYSLAQELYGGTAWGTDDPLVSGSVQSGSETVATDGDDYTYANIYDLDAADNVYDLDQYNAAVYDDSGYGTDSYIASYFDAYLYGFEEFLPDDLETAFAVTDMTGLTRLWLHL